MLRVTIAWVGADDGGLHNARDFVRSIGSPVASPRAAIRTRGFRGGISSAGWQDSSTTRRMVGERGRGWQIICPASLPSPLLLFLSPLRRRFVDAREKQGTSLCRWPESQLGTSMSILVIYSQRGHIILGNVRPCNCAVNSTNSWMSKRMPCSYLIILSTQVVFNWIINITFLYWRSLKCDY